MRKNTVVISLGGSLVNPGKPDFSYINKISRLLETLDYSFGVVVGGGRLARQYAERERKKGKGEFEADLAAIKATKINANLLIKSLKRQAYSKVCSTFDEAKRASKKYKIVVMGGTIPGITTDADAALLAECLHARRLVNISNIDGIYDRNPSKFHDARKYRYMKFEELLLLSNKEDLRLAGGHFVFDILGCKIIARSKIETHFVSGKNLSDVSKAIQGKRHNGTIVSS
ncbi:MAG: UMP kinase [Candidatus Anstonellales archaeon]